MHNETEKMVDYDFLPFDNADIGIVFYLKQHEFHLKQEHALQLERNMVPMLIISTETSTKTCLSYKVLERGRKMVEAILDISSMLDAAWVVLYNKITAMKFKKDIIILSQYLDREKIFSDRRDNKNLFKNKRFWWSM